MPTEFILEEDRVYYRSSKEMRAESVVRNSMLWTGAAGIIPIPIVDFAAISALQLNMLYKIGDIYEQRFSSTWGKSVIGSLIGGYTATALGRSVVRNVLGSIPIIGPIANLVVLPGFAAASTWALGQIFIMHFESGGTILTFDPVLVQEHYSRLVKKHMKAEEKEKEKETTAHKPK